MTKRLATLLLALLLLVTALPASAAEAKKANTVLIAGQEVRLDAKEFTAQSGGLTNQDIEPLRQLTQLTYLDLRWNGISDLTPLASLKKLERLELSGNQISDLSPLAGLTKLKIIDISANPGVTDLSALAGMTGLTRFWMLGDSYSPVADASPLADKKFLERLGIQTNDLASLQKLTGLNMLTLICDADVDLTPLAGLTKMRTMSLRVHGNDWRQGDPVRRDISVLTDMKSMQNLWLQGYAGELTPLAGMKRLEILDVAGQFDELSPLAGLDRLSYLILNSPALSDLSPLVGLKTLNSLDLTVEQVPDLLPLNKSKKLDWLSLRCNTMTDATALAGLTIPRLNLRGQALRDVSALAGLTQLKGLGLWATEPLDLTALEPLAIDPENVYLQLIDQNDQQLNTDAYDPNELWPGETGLYPAPQDPGLESGG